VAVIVVAALVAFLILGVGAVAIIPEIVQRYGRPRGTHRKSQSLLDAID
jgi:hypothetical protein